jgi:hypothetical protein
VQDGAALRIPLSVNRRLTLSLFQEGDPAPLCTWVPLTKFYANERGCCGSWNPLDLLPLHRLGETIRVHRQDREFRIDGQPMRVVAENGIEALARDPAPRIGVRNIESSTHVSPSLFADVEIRPAVVSVRPATRFLAITDTGLASLRKPIWLVLFNRHEERLHLNCGRLNALTPRDNFEDSHIAHYPGIRKRRTLDDVVFYPSVQPGETGIYTYFMPDSRGYMPGDGRRRF